MLGEKGDIHHVKAAPVAGDHTVILTKLVVNWCAGKGCQNSRL